MTGLGIARRLLEANKLEPALLQIDKTLSGNPEFADAYGLKGVVLERMGDLEGAARSFKLEARLKPDDPNGWMGLGQVQMKRGSLQKALAATDRAIALIETKSQQAPRKVYILRAQILLQLQRPGDAVKAYKSALKHEPNLVEAHLELGQLLARHGKVYKGIKHLMTAAQLSPDDPTPLISMGDAWRAHGDLERAHKQYMAAQQLAPYDSTIYVRLGDMYVEHNLMGEALGLYRIATLFDSKNAHCFLQLGVIYIAECRYEEAIVMLRKASKLDPKLVLAKELLGQAQSALSGGVEASAESG